MAISILPVRQLALEDDRQARRRRGRREPERDPRQHARRARFEHECLEEEHRLEPLAVDAREPERGEPDRPARSRAERLRRRGSASCSVEAGEVLVPVDPVVEPVEDQQQDADRDQRDDRLEPLAVARERAEHRLRDDPGGGARDERDADADEQRPAEAARWAPTMLAISAARISTASSPSRKTIIALLETTDPVEPAAGADPPPRHRRARRRARRASPPTSAARAFRLIELDEPGVAAGAVPETAPRPRWNEPGRQPRSRCSGPSSKTPYASSRACSALP